MPEDGRNLEIPDTVNIDLLDSEQVYDNYKHHSTQFLLTDKRLLRYNTWGSKRAKQSSTSLYYDSIERVRTHHIDDAPPETIEVLAAVGSFCAAALTGLIGLDGNTLALTVAAVLFICGVIALAIALDTEDGHTKLKIYTTNGSHWSYKYPEASTTPAQLANAITTQRNQQ